MLRRTLSIIAVSAALMGCGATASNTDTSTGSEDAPAPVDPDRELAAAQIAPPPVVNEVALPNLTDGGTAEVIEASPGKLRLVYFGYTGCPDFCPTTMSEVSATLNSLQNPTDVEVTMVTVDPERDLEALAEYVQAFVPDGTAMGTDDAALLAAAAAPFGASYSVEPNPEFETDPDAMEVIVSHTTSLYAVDDTGHLVMTWAYGTPVAEITADIEQYLAYPSNLAATDSAAPANG